MKRHNNKRAFAKRLSERIEHYNTLNPIPAPSDVPLFVIKAVRYAPHRERTYIDVHVFGAATLKLVSMISGGERVVFAACLVKSDGLRWSNIDDIDDAFARAVLVALDEYERREDDIGAA